MAVKLGKLCVAREQQIDETMRIVDASMARNLNISLLVKQKCIPQQCICKGFTKK